MSTGFVDRLIAHVLSLDPGARARLRRGAQASGLLLLPGMATFAGDREGDDLDDALLAARIAAILGANSARHPAAGLAEAEFHERRMARLLASDPEVLPDRLLVAARFLAAKRVRAAAAPFYYLVRGARSGRGSAHRIEWARRFGETLDALQSGRRKTGDSEHDRRP